MKNVPALFDDVDLPAERPTAELPPGLARPDLTGRYGTLGYQPERSEKMKDGTVVQRPARWKLQGSPAVVMLARRLFAGMASRSPDKASWPAFEPDFEDLLMLQHRYPVTLDRAARDVWEEQYQATVRRHLAMMSPQPVEAGDIFRGKLLQFQEEGLRFLMGSRKALLADDMGLGKTPTGLAFIAAANEWPAVIVCQPHVQRHWQRKIEEFLDVVPADQPLMSTAAPVTWTTLTGTRRRPAQDQAHIYLVHYLVLHAWADWLTEQGVRTVVFDECQELRRPGTRKHEACLALARGARNVTGLSGTPIYNSGPEIYNVVNTLNRGSLGTKTQFTDDWCDYDAATGKPVVVAPDMLGQYMRDRHLMLRRRKDDVMTELPAKQRVIEPIDADNALFADLVSEAVKLAKDAEDEANPFDRARMEAEAISQTRKATGVAKVPAVLPFLRGLMEAEEPTLVFAHHHAVHGEIEETLSEFAPACITGHQTVAQKDSEQSRFMAGETNLCLIALRAATGLDGLQGRARVVVFAELDWSPAVHRQAEDRAHRMGQKNGVLVYYLVGDVGTDPFVLSTLQVKESQFTGLMHDPEMTADDIAAADAAAERHKQSVLDMLRSR